MITEGFAARLARLHQLQLARTNRLGRSNGAMLSIITPVLNEEDGIAATLQALSPLRARGAEVIVVDGGSRDRTVERARPLCNRLIAAPRGRATQMNAGAGAAGGDAVLFLVADTPAAAGADPCVLAGLAGRGPRAAVRGAAPTCGAPGATRCFRSSRQP